MTTESAGTMDHSRFNWQAPPFAGGRCGARVDLRPIALAGWLTPLAGGAVLAHKHNVLSQFPSLCSALWPAAGGALALQRGEQRLAECMSSAAWAQPAPARIEPSVPLQQAALQVHEDLCLMWCVAGSYRLLAANLCRPSYWSLTEKLGHSLEHIHAGVADLTAEQQQRMQSVFEKLPSDRVFERRNWFLHASGNGFEPGPDSASYEGYAGPWFVRSERQTLRRLDVDLLLFAIRVDIEPLYRARDYPQARKDLLRALHALDGTALQDFGGTAKRSAALQAVQDLSPTGRSANA